MNDHKAAIQYTEGQQLLFDNSYRSIPFNVTQAALLAIYLYYNLGPKEHILIWVAGICIISCIRMIHCKIVKKSISFTGSINFHLKIFLCLTWLTSLIWTSVYFISIPYVQMEQQYIIILVFGGMTAGSTISLAVYFPAFLAYTQSIFLPVIIYNYCGWDVNHAILATMCLFFLLAITIVAQANQSLLKNMFLLTEQNKILSDKFEMLSITDSLTGLYNRRHFTKVIQEEFNRSKRNQQSFSLISIDVDNFKLINDGFGHPFGDKFITYTANYLKHYLRRANDIIFRLGGDEFTAILLNTNEEETKQICNIIKNQFVKTPKFDYEPQDIDHQKLLAQVSMSIGIVYIPYDSTTTIDQIIEIADNMLYQSKNEGKNQIKYINCKDGNN